MFRNSKRLGIRCGLYFLFFVLAACASPEGQMEPVELDSSDELDAEVLIEGEAFIFTLEIYRYAAISHEGYDSSIEEKAAIEMIGVGDLVSGEGSGPAKMIQLIGETCEQVCDYGIEFEVTGFFKPAPTCELVLHVEPSTQNGQCRSDCPTENFTIYWPGITDATIDPVIFYPEEIGFHTLSNEEVTDRETIGNEIWTNQFKIMNFEGNPQVDGCNFNF